MDYYFRKTSKEITQRKYEEYERYWKVIQEGRRNPVWYLEWAYGVALIDWQRWVVMESWTRQYVLWLEGRAAGKSSVSGLYSVTRMDLLPNYKIWISCNSAGQSEEYFKGLEDIILKRNPHFRTINEMISEEIETTANNKDGFSHDPMGNNFSMYNGSKLVTVSSKIENARGKRGAFVSDESGWMTAERAAVIDHYAAVDNDFSLGVGSSNYIDPPALPLQMMYVSSAGDIDTPFYNKMVTFSKQMFMGDPNYFVCNIDSPTVVRHSTFNGEPIKPHITEEYIAKSVMDDPEKADRELFNHFRKGGGKNAVVSADTILRNSSVYAPVLYNDTRKRKFIFALDPARQHDTSTMLVFELLEDKNVGAYIKLVNAVSFVDTKTKKKTPLPMPEQIRLIRNMLIAYNGDRVPDYENIVDFIIDAGAGGGGISAVADNLMADWTDDDGVVHKGIIDPVHPQYATSRDKYAHAVRLVRLVEPTSYKKLMFDAYEKLSKLDLIKYPDYDGKEYLLIGDDKDVVREYHLTETEQISLDMCNLAITQIRYMCRMESPNGAVTFALAPEKASIMHDDLAYALAEGAYALSLIRRNDLNKMDDTPIDIGHMPSLVTNLAF